MPGPFDPPLRPPIGGNASGLDNYQSGLSPQVASEITNRRNAGSGGLGGEAPSFDESIETGKKGEFWGNVGQKIGAGLWTFVAHASLGIVPAAVTFASWVGRKSDEREAKKMEANFAKGVPIVEPGKRYEISGRTKGIDLSNIPDSMQFFYANVDKKGQLVTREGAKINERGQAVDANNVPLPAHQQPTRNLTLRELRRDLAARSVLEKYQPIHDRCTPIVQWLKRPHNEHVANVGEVGDYLNAFPDRFAAEADAWAIPPAQLPGAPVITGFTPAQMTKLMSAVDAEALADPTKPVNEVLQRAIIKNNTPAPGAGPLPPDQVLPDLTPAQIAEVNGMRDPLVALANHAPGSRITAIQFAAVMNKVNRQDLSDPNKNVHEVLQDAINRHNNPPPPAAPAAAPIPNLYEPTAPLSDEQIADLNNMRGDLVKGCAVAQILYATPRTDEERADLAQLQQTTAATFNKELTKADAAIAAANNGHFSLEDNLKVDLLVLEQMRAQKIGEVATARRDFIRVNNNAMSSQADIANAKQNLDRAQREHDNAIEKINASSQRIRGWYLQLQGHKLEPEMKQSWTNKIAAGLFGREESQTASKVYSERHGLKNIGRWRLEYRDIVDPADPNNRKVAGIRCSNKLISKSQARDIGGTLASQALKKGIPTATATGFEARLISDRTPDQLTKILEAGPKDKNGKKNEAYEKLGLSMARDGALEAVMQDCMGVKVAPPKEWDKVSATHKQELVAMKDAAKQAFITEELNPMAKQKFGKDFSQLNILEKAAIGQAHASMDNKEAHPYVRMLVTQNKDKIEQETGITNVDDAIARVSQLAAQRSPNDAAPAPTRVDLDANRTMPR